MFTAKVLFLIKHLLISIILVNKDGKCVDTDIADSNSLAGKNTIYKLFITCIKFRRTSCKLLLVAFLEFRNSKVRGPYDP